MITTCTKLALVRAMLILALGCFALESAQAQFLEPRGEISTKKRSSQMEILVPIGEPVQIEFDQTVVGGFKPAKLALNMELRGRSLLMTAPNGLPARGSAVVVRLQDGEEVLLILRPE